MREWFTKPTFNRLEVFVFIPITGTVMAWVAKNLAPAISIAFH